jgi:flagellar biogenesis protein FliO
MSANTGASSFTGLRTLLRRFFSGFGRRSVVGGALEHLGNLPLTAHSSLALVRLHKETLLLGITANSITLLSKSNEEMVVGPNSVAPDRVESREEWLLPTGGAAR